MKTRLDNEVAEKFTTKASLTQKINGCLDYIWGISSKTYQLSGEAPSCQVDDKAGHQEPAARRLHYSCGGIACHQLTESETILIRYLDGKPRDMLW